MGTFATASYEAINQGFYASSLEVREGVEPVVISALSGPKDVASCELHTEGDTMQVAYRLLDATIDDADFARLFTVAYLDVLSAHHWHDELRPRRSTARLVLTNMGTGVVTSLSYPDPAQGIAPEAIVRDVFRYRLKNWGPADARYTFEKKSPELPVERTDVLIYRPTSTLAMTSFATLGMATAAQADGSRTELHFARRGDLTVDDERAVANQLANLALFPWPGRSIGWGHMVGLASAFPGFPSCTAVFLSGPLVPGGMDHVRTSEGSVRIVNVVPITAAERERARTMNPLAFIVDLMTRLCIYTPR